LPLPEKRQGQFLISECADSGKKLEKSRNLPEHLIDESGNL
jgi:hypothetical protein